MQPTTRRVVHPSPSHSVRLLHLLHLQTEPIEADSSWERDFVHIAALHHRVTSIRHQPFKLTWPDRTYTPDFLITFKDQSKLVVEVKPLAKQTGYVELFKLATQKLSEHAIGFLVVSERHLFNNYRAHNAALIRRYSKTSYPAGDLNCLISEISDSPDGKTVSQLCSNNPEKLAMLRHLIAFRRIQAQPNLSTEPDATVSTPIQY